jgi:hypothetical protein
VLGEALAAHAPPQSQRLSVLNDVWKVVSKIKSPVEYMRIARVFVRYLVVNFTVREVNIFLKDVIKHVKASRKTRGGDKKEKEKEKEKSADKEKDEEKDGGGDDDAGTTANGEEEASEIQVGVIASTHRFCQSLLAFAIKHSLTLLLFFPHLTRTA